jgi:hypothetical protein
LEKLPLASDAFSCYNSCEKELEMKRFVIAALATIAVPAGARAYYLGASAGSSGLKVDGEKASRGAAYAIYGGTSFPIPLVTIPLRAEAEFSHMKSGYGSPGRDFTTRGFAVNGYFDFASAPSLTTYLGLGIGRYEQVMEVLGAKYESGWSEAVQYMLGAKLKLPVFPASLGVEYRLMNANFDYGAQGSHKSRINALYTTLGISF